MRLLCLLCLALLPAAAYSYNQNHSRYHLIDASFQHQAPALFAIETRWQDGDETLNQFRIKRLVSLKPHVRYHQPILMVAPFNATLEQYALTSSGNYQDSFEAQLALAGFDVWIIEDRIFTGDPADCDGLVDCSVMGTWGLGLRNQDIEFARSLLQHATHENRPIIGGTTGGGMAAIAAINANPDHYRALFSTGGLYSADEEIRAHNQLSCDNFRTEISEGILYRDALGGLDVLIAAARDYPEEISAVDPSVSNYQFIVNILTGSGALGFLAFTPSYRFAAPNETLDDYKYMNAEVFYQDTQTFGKLVSHSHFADIKCSIAGERTFTGHLDQFKGNVLFLGGGSSMAPLEIDNAKLFTQAVVQVIVDPTDGGEADNYLVDYSFREEVLDQPLINWLQQQYD